MQCGTWESLGSQVPLIWRWLLGDFLGGLVGEDGVLVGILGVTVGVGGVLVGFFVVAGFVVLGCGVVGFGGFFVVGGGGAVGFVCHGGSPVTGIVRCGRC